MKRRTFILLGGATVAAGALGTTSLLWREQRRRRRTVKAEQLPPLETQTLAQIKDTDQFDVCIVGSGISGAVLGTALSDAGISTIILESGYHPRSSQQARIGPLEVANTRGTLDYPLLTTRLRALGGTTNIWTGNCYRFHPADFDSNPYAEKVGAWPITYAQVEPWYARAEETLRVRGGLSASYSPRRSNELSPYLARPVFPELDELFQRARVELEAYPISQTALEDREPVRSLKSLLPEYVTRPGTRLVSGATVTKLITSDHGEVVGAEARDLDRTQRTVRAGTYVIAAGATEGARLLLLSASNRFPHGLGNSSDQVGRNFNEHVSRMLSARLPGYRTKMSQRARCYCYHEEFLQRELGGLGFTVQQRKEKPEQILIEYDVPLRPTASNRVTLAGDRRDALGNPAVQLDFSFSESDEIAYGEARRRLEKVCRSLGAVDIRPEQGYHWSHHHMSTLRMGADPTNSVVNADLRLHDSPNTYVLGSGTFSSSGAGHPTLLIVALTHRLGEHLVARVGKTRTA